MRGGRREQGPGWWHRVGGCAVNWEETALEEEDYNLSTWFSLLITCCVDSLFLCPRRRAGRLPSQVCILPRHCSLGARVVLAPARASVSLPVQSGSGRREVLADAAPLFSKAFLSHAPR